MTSLIETIGNTGGPTLVALTLVLVFAESAILLDLLAPGEVALVLAGAAAHDAGVPLWLIIVAAAIGGLAGDSAGYWLGRRVGLPVTRKWKWLRRRLQPRVKRAEKYFDRRGGVAVALARWVGALRAVVPVTAGTAKMPYGTFLAWDVPSTTAWCAVAASAGFVYGDDVAKVIDRVGLVVSLVVVAAALAVLAWRKMRTRRRE